MKISGLSYKEWYGTMKYTCFSKYLFWYTWKIISQVYLTLPLSKKRKRRNKFKKNKKKNSPFVFNWTENFSDTLILTFLSFFTLENVILIFMIYFILFTRQNFIAYILAIDLKKKKKNSILNLYSYIPFFFSFFLFYLSSVQLCLICYLHKDSLQRFYYKDWWPSSSSLLCLFWITQFIKEHLDCFACCDVFCFLPLILCFFDIKSLGKKHVMKLNYCSVFFYLPLLIVFLLFQTTNVFSIFIHWLA